MNYRLPLTVLATMMCSAAAAESVSAAVKTEANALAQQYTGRSCRADYDLDTERFSRPLSAAQQQLLRDKWVSDWKWDLAKDAKKDGYRYDVRFSNNRVWYWTQDKKGKREFGVVSITSTGIRELSCDQ